VQRNAGAIANMCVYFALLEPATASGDAARPGRALDAWIARQLLRQLYSFIAYGVDPATEIIDMDDVAKKARESRPKMIVAGATRTSHPRLRRFP